MTIPSDNSTEGRLSRLEATTHALADSQAKMVDQMAAGFKELKDSSKVQWGPLISAAGVLLAIGGMFGTGLTDKLALMHERQLEAEERFYLHEHSTGHAGLAQIVEGNGDSLEKLDEVLQREMRILDSRMETVIEGLDERLQIEMRLLTTPIQQRLDDLDEAAIRERAAREAATSKRFDSEDFQEFLRTLEVRLGKIEGGTPDE